MDVFLCGPLLYDKQGVYCGLCAHMSNNKARFSNSQKERISPYWNVMMGQHPAISPSTSFLTQSEKITCKAHTLKFVTDKKKNKTWIWPHVQLNSLVPFDYISLICTHSDTFIMLTCKIKQNKMLVHGQRVLYQNTDFWSLICVLCYLFYVHGLGVLSSKLVAFVTQ